MQLCADLALSGEVTAERRCPPCLYPVRTAAHHSSILPPPHSEYRTYLSDELREKVAPEAATSGARGIRTRSSRRRDRLLIIGANIPILNATLPIRCLCFSLRLPFDVY